MKHKAREEVRKMIEDAFRQLAIALSPNKHEICNCQTQQDDHEYHKTAAVAILGAAVHGAVTDGFCVVSTDGEHQAANDAMDALKDFVEQYLSRVFG